MKIFIGVNVLTDVSCLIYSNHMQFWYRLGKHFPNDSFIFYTPARASIDRMRNESARLALENECDYLMFIDDDVLVPFDSLKKMIAAGKDVICGHTVIRGYPYNTMAFKLLPNEGLTYYNDYKDNLDENHLVKCGAVGFSCVLIKVDVLKRMRPPFFVTGAGHTEDVWFCMEARRQLGEISIYMDPSIETGHILGPQIVTPRNKDLLKKYDEEENPSLLEVENDRGINYLKSIGALNDSKE